MEVVSTACNSRNAKRKRNRKRNMNSSEQEDGKPNFKPFDYTKANFNRFVTSGQKNIKQLLSTKITFGASKKEVSKYLSQNLWSFCSSRSLLSLIELLTLKGDEPKYFNLWWVWWCRLCNS